MTCLCIWCLGKRSLEHSPTQQGEFWALEQDSPVFTHTSLQYVLIHTRWHPWFLQSLQLFSEQTCSAQTFTGWGVGHPSPSHHKHKVEKLQRQLAELEHPLLQLLQLLSSTPALLCLQHTDKASARPRARKDALMRQEHRCSMASHQGAMSREQSHDKADYYKCRIYIHPLVPISQVKRCLRWHKATGKAAGGACVPSPCWVVGEAASLGGVMLGQCHKVAASGQHKPFHHTAKVVSPAPQGPAEKQPLRGLGCPWVPAGSSVAAIAWQWAHDISKKLLSCLLTYKHVKTSDHQKHQWQHQGEADVDL